MWIPVSIHATTETNGLENPQLQTTRNNPKRNDSNNSVQFQNDFTRCILIPKNTRNRLYSTSRCGHLRAEFDIHHLWEVLLQTLDIKCAERKGLTLCFPGLAQTLRATLPFNSAGNFGCDTWKCGGLGSQDFMH